MTTQEIAARAGDARSCLNDGRKGVALLGSTGSVGTTALRVLERQREHFAVVALTAFSNEPLLKEQAERFNPALVGMVRAASNGDWLSGKECLTEAATLPEADIVLNAVVGAAGLDATIAALEHGKRVALANKETLVVGGELVLRAAERGGGELVPVDSEHSAILQCMAARPASEIRRLVLTASGGPFRTWPRERLQRATIADALQHPTWSMGRKITVDSATLANKALEVIEAHFLFGIPYDRIDVIVHPQSVVHSFVEFVDGSVVAQLGVPSMELPVLYALTHPDRLPDTGVPPFDPVELSPLTFEPVRSADFPALSLGLLAGRSGGAAPATFNAANEVAVELFLRGEIGFAQIPHGIEHALARLVGAPSDSRESLLAADASARRLVTELFA